MEYMYYPCYFRIMKIKEKMLRLESSWQKARKKNRYIDLK